MKQIEAQKPNSLHGRVKANTEKGVAFRHNVMVISLPNGPRQANLVLIAYASSEGSGEPAHPRSLARTFAARSYKQ